MNQATTTAVEAPQRARGETSLASTLMTSTNLDSSNHSVCTPIPTTEKDNLMLPMPLSPNAVEQFPEDVTSSSTGSEGVGTLVKANSLKDMMACPLPCSIISSDCSSLDTNTVATTTKSVSFSPMVRVKDVLSRYEMSVEERHDYWLQDFEFLMIKRRNQKTLQTFLDSHEQESETSTANESEKDSNSAQHTTVATENQDKKQQEEECCIRGLESALPNESLRKRSYRFAALEEVFLEQDDQYFAGIYDDEAIAEAYLEVSVECRFRAEFRAIQDRKAIEEYLQQGPQFAFETNPADADEFAL